MDTDRGGQIARERFAITNDSSELVALQ
jgi:hypothetical protein